MTVLSFLSIKHSISCDVQSSTKSFIRRTLFIPPCPTVRGRSWPFLVVATRVAPSDENSLQTPNIMFIVLPLLVLGAIQVLRHAVGGGRVSDFPEKKRYEDVPFNVIRVTRGWVGVKFPGKSVT